VPISREVYDRRMEWSRTKTLDQIESHDFHRAFLGEYVANSITRIDSTDPTRKCRINIGTVHNDKQLNPFNFVIKNLPDSILIENLCLSYEEAFYLSYALGCLRILNGIDDSVMTNSELWKFFSTKDDRFACKYIVYHKLRSTGWILKSGIKYGTDFLVYYKGPEQYHSSFSVIVKQLSGTTLDVDGASSFMKLAGLIRINENVSKEVIICYVLFDPNSYVDLSKPNCIKHACVYQMAVRRWIPEENRSESSTLISDDII
jgi:tRNA-intron lyase